jgi:predicted nucleic acid-binding protein
LRLLRVGFAEAEQQGLMSLLDTNVVSDLRMAKAGRADKNVVAWVAGAAASSMFVSAVTVRELEIGVLLAERRDPARGAVLRRWLEAQVLPAFVERILPVDTAVARRGATLHVPDPRPVRDSLIAATALVHGMPVVTRNVAGFAPAARRRWPEQVRII